MFYICLNLKHVLLINLNSAGCPGERMLELAAFKNFWAKWREMLLSLFILFNVLALGLGLFPDCSQRNFLIAPFQSYLWAVGLWQGRGAGVFAPDPPKAYLDISARVTLKDGSVKYWRCWDYRRYNYFLRFFKGKYRKLCFNIKENSRWLPDVALFAARSFFVGSNPPLKVEMIRVRIDIPPPGAKQDAPISEVFYKRKLLPEDLK